MEQKFDVNLDDDDIMPTAFLARPSTDNPAERPSNKLERPSDVSLSDFKYDKDEFVQAEDEQYSDDFETVEKPKEIDLIIQDRTKKYVEYSASALNLSGIKLESLSKDQQTEEILKLINYE